MISRTAAILVLAVALAGGCQNRDQSASGEPVTEVKEARNAVSQELMIALGQAKNFHGKADVYVKNGEVAKAIAEVENVLEIQFPEGAPEAEDVILDARARLAKLLLGKGEVARARKVVDQGLANPTRKSFFVANLHTVRGEVIEAEAETLAETDAEAAKKLRLEAIREYDRSIAINEEIQKRLLEGDGE